MAAANRNESELLFEEYLTAHGYANWSTPRDSIALSGPVAI